MKELLREWYEMCPDMVCQDLLSEGEKLEVKNGAKYLTGIMQRSDTENGNGRVYGRKVLDREIENYKKIVADHRALGELDHPEDSVVNLKNVSHMVTDIWWNGDGVMGKIKVLDTPSGKILRSLVESGVKLGISSRGLGSTRKEGGKTIVEDDFQLICFDFVQEPSTPGAFMMSEGKNRIVDPNKIWTKADRLNRLLNDIVKG
jgi:hypothetical protein